MKFPAFCGPFYTSQSSNVTCEEAINWFLEQVELNGKSSFSMYMRPGYEEFFSIGADAIGRGALPLNGHAFFVFDDTVYDLLSDGTAAASYSPIEDDGQSVHMAAGGGRDGAGNVNQLGIVSGGKAYYIEGGSLQEVSWLGGTPVSGIGYLDTYFVFLSALGDGFYYSEPNDIDTGSLLNFISAEASANNFNRLIVQNERIWLFGELVAQVFYDNSAVDPQNPFAADLSAVIQQGTAAAASPTSFDNSIGWIGRNESGQGIAWRNNGYTPTRVSNFAVEAAWARYSTIEDAIGYAVTVKGHTLWRLWFQAANETWEYDASLPPALSWRKILYWNLERSMYEADRGSCACMAFGKMLVGDRQNGKVYTLSLDNLWDDDVRIRTVRRAPIITNENKMTSFPWIELDMQTGIGDNSADATDPEYDPMVSLRVSKNWGKTWSTERLRSVGKEGEYGKRVIWTKNGTGRQYVIETTTYAAARFVINNCYLRDPLGRAT